MDLIRRYHWYRHLLQICFALNAFFIMLGGVALIRWFQTHDPTEAELLIVGVGTFVFGVLGPFYLLKQFSKKTMELKKQMELMVVQYVSEWIVALEQYEDAEPLKDPKFWLNMSFLLAETLGEHSDHPFFQVVTEISPLLRKEIRREKARPRAKRRYELTNKEKAS